MALRRALRWGGWLAVAMSLPGQPAHAQRTADSQVVVTAAINQGVFICTYSVASFDFGDVSSQGADFGSPNVVAGGRNGDDTGGVYTSSVDSITWTCRASPQSTVTVALRSTAVDHTLGGMAADDLEARIPATAGGTSTGFQRFTSQADLITGMNVRNGGNAAAGRLDLRLTVLDVDPPGANSWRVRLRATGAP